GQIAPALPARCRIASGSPRKRFAVTSTAPSAGSSASSATCANASLMICPPLTSGIDALPERFDAEPLHRVDEQLVGVLAQCQIGFDDVLDDVGNLAIGHRRPDQRTELGV